MITIQHGKQFLKIKSDEKAFEFSLCFGRNLKNYSNVGLLRNVAAKVSGKCIDQYFLRKCKNYTKIYILPKFITSIQ